MDRIGLALYIKTSDKLNNPILNKQLTDLFPFMRPRDAWSGKDLTTDPDFDWTWTLINEIPNGWRKAFGWRMLNELSAVMDGETFTDWEGEELPLNENYYPVQIKEKFGELRWYSNFYIEKIEEVIRKYQDLSRRTCVNCGRPARYISIGWICPWCEYCAADVKDEMVPIEDWFSEEEEK